MQCNLVKVKHLRILLIDGHQRFSKKGGFDSKQYIREIKEAESKIKLLNKIPISNVKEENFDTYQPKQIDVSKADSWIRYKFELVYKFKAIEPQMEGRNIEFWKMWWKIKTKRYMLQLYTTLIQNWWIGYQK